MSFEPAREDRFSAGLWCTAFRGREVFGREVRGELDPLDNIRGLTKIGCFGFNFHDDDLVPFGSSAADTTRILKDARRVMNETGAFCGMATCNMFEHPVFKDGALTSNDARVRAYARQKAMRAIDMGAELGASVFVMWGGREGLEVEASKDPIEAIERYREGVEFLANYIHGAAYQMRIAIEPKPNEPRGDIFLATAGHVLAFVATLDPSVREMVGVNPEIQQLVAQLRIEDPELVDLSEWSRDNAKALKERRFDLGAMSERRLGYQKLDQLVFDLLTGAR